MGLVCALPFGGGLYAFLLFRWARQFTVPEAEVTGAMIGCDVVELAFLCGGERRASATALGALVLQGESPGFRSPVVAVARAQQRLIDAGLLQQAVLSRTLHFILALLPVVGLGGFCLSGRGSPGETLLFVSLAVGLGSLVHRIQQGRGSGRELSAMGQEVSFRFRARHRALGFVESWFPMLPSGPAMPAVGLVCGLFIVCGPPRWADALEHRPPGPKRALPRLQVIDKAVAASPVQNYVAPKYVPPGSANRDPEVAYEFKVPYPDDARRAGIEGTVHMRIVVDNEGRVVEVLVLTGPGFGLNEVAREAIKRFKFRAAIKDGEAVSTTLVYNYTFLLD